MNETSDWLKNINRIAVKQCNKFYHVNVYDFRAGLNGVPGGAVPTTFELLLPQNNMDLACFNLYRVTFAECWAIFLALPIRN